MTDNLPWCHNHNQPWGTCRSVDRVIDPRECRLGNPPSKFEPNPLVPHPDRPGVWVREETDNGFSDFMGGGEPQAQADGLIRYPNQSGSSHSFASPEPNRTEPRPPSWQPLDGASELIAGFWQHVLTWVGVALSGWITFLVARAVMDASLSVLGLGGSALAAAGVGAVAGLVGWAVERKP